MDKENAARWLDNIIDKQSELKAACRDLTMQSNATVICSGITEWVQIYSGIEALAEALGIELKRGAGNKYDHLTFKYRGVEIIQVVEKLEKEGQEE